MTYRTRHTTTSGMAWNSMRRSSLRSSVLGFRKGLKRGFLLWVTTWLGPAFEVLRPASEGKTVAGSAAIVLEAIEKLDGSRKGIEQILVGTAHFSCIQSRRVQQREVDVLNVAGPSGMPLRPDMVLDQPVCIRVAVKVECGRGLADENVIPREVIVRLDPDSLEATVLEPFQKDSGQYMAGAVAKEDAVRKLPSSKRVLLDTGLQDVHAHPLNAGIRRQDLWPGTSIFRRPPPTGSADTVASAPGRQIPPWPAIASVIRVRPRHPARLASSPPASPAVAAMASDRQCGSGCARAPAWTRRSCS